jgi:dihydroxyacetone kinase
MTRIHNDPDRFVDEALEGLVLAHPGRLRRVDGGVVRHPAAARGHVAVVIGGGSGHYPAFAGLVGPGVATAAVCGNIFTSPSSAAAMRVARAAETGGGVLFSYGNYAGDVLHFGEAERRLRAEGMDVRTVLVTDDVASAPVDQAQKRRGIAGDLCVFRIAGAAAERGDDLDEVERLARKANDRTRSLGVGFAGCTLPGADSELFTVPDGMMSVGLGIHGEPGIRDVPLQSASRLARTLVEPLLAERPAGAGARVCAIVNGLGAVKYEELFVLFRDIAGELSAAGLEIVAPVCGELVTSLDMAGVSLTLLWLDDELEQLWTAPADAPAFVRRGPLRESAGAAPEPRDEETAAVADAASAVPASERSQRHAREAARLIRVAHDAVAERAGELGDLDAVAGDGDHGTGMVRGLHAALAASADTAAGAAALLVRAGDAWSDEAGGTSGALWGAALVALGEGLGDADEATPPHLAHIVDLAVRRLAALGGAEPGDKTMLDAMLPFAESLRQAVDRATALDRALDEAAAAAEHAASATAALRPRRGRSRPLAERSVGHPDPGAVSFAIIARAVADAAATGPAGAATEGTSSASAPKIAPTVTHEEEERT